MRETDWSHTIVLKEARSLYLFAKLEVIVLNTWDPVYFAIVASNVYRDAT